MATLLEILMLAIPLAAMAALVTLADRRRARRGTEIARQIALTDALHARLGAAVAPFVRWRRSRWKIAVAVPFERPAVVAAVLATVDEAFEGAAYEVILRRQAAPLSWPRRTASLGEKSLSWT